MSEWREYTVGDIAEVFDGPHATPAKTDAGPWFLSISSLDSGRLDLSQSAHILEEDFERWTRRVTPSAGDVLFSYETRLGEAALMPEGIRAALGRRMALLRPRPELVEPRFLLLAYLSPDFQQVIHERKIHGATVDRIPLVDLPRWPIKIPDLPTQRLISAILGALDDKIAVNDRIAATALELAEALYLRASSGQDWSSIELGSVATWYSGGTPKTSDPRFWNGDIPWISALSLKSVWIETSERRLTELGAASGTRLVPAGVVIFVVRGSSLKEEFRVGLTQREVAFGQDCKALVPSQGIDPHILFHGIRSARNQILDLVDETSIGAGRLSTDLIAKLTIRVPPEAASKAVNEVRSLDQLSAVRAQESRTLAALRDTLLPELMSGRLRVKDAEKVVEEAV